MKKINKIMSFALALTITAGVAAGTVVTGAEYDINNEAAAFSEPVADAAEADENGFIIENNILTGYTGTGGSITIPDTVFTIGSKAFKDNKAITRVTIPDSVLKIESSAFSGCTGITKVNFGKSITSIGSEAFYGCTSLTEAILPEGLLTAECGSYPYNGVFTGCTALKKVYIPSTLNSAARLFKNCSALDGSEVTFGAGIIKLPGSLFRECSGLKTITLPETLTSVSSSMFLDCTNLTGVSIPDSVTEIGESAFSNCELLSKVNFGKGLTKIGSEAFYGCKSLTEAILPEGLLTAECGSYPYNGVFTGCTALTKVYIPSSLNSAARLFKNCSALDGSKVTFGTGTVKLPDGLFRECTGLKTITLPETLRTVSDYLFYDCAKLSGVTIPNSTSSIGKCGFYNCEMLAKVNFGTGLTKIGAEAFYGCTSLTEIYLPEGLTTAECGSYPYNGVFTNNTSLRAVDFPLSLTDAKNIFKGCTNLYDIYYNGSKEQWDKIDLGTESLPEAAVIHYNGYRVQAVESITVSALPTKTVYKKGEALDVTGGKITVKYEGDKADEIINITAAMCTGFDSKTAGTKTITVTYNGKTATFTVTVEDSGTPDPVEEGTVIEVGTGKDCTGLTAALTTINNAVKKNTADTAYTLILTDKTYTEKKALAFPAVKVIIKGDEGTVVTAPSVTAKGDLVLENITLKTAKGAAAAVTAKKSLTATNSTLGKTTATGDAVLDNCTVGVLTAKGSLTIDGGSFEAVTVSAKKGTTTLNNTVNIAKNLTVSNDLVIVGNSTVGGKFTAKAGLNINGFIVKNGK